MDTANFLNQKNKINLKSRLKHPAVIIAAIIILLGTNIFAAQKLFVNQGKIQGEKLVNAAKQVKTMELGVDGNGQANIETTGTVKADNQVDIFALAAGTVKGIYFKTGDKVSAGQLLVSIYDSTIAASLANAQTSVNNMQLSLNSNERTLAENIKQAELGVKRAQESIESAKIGLQTAQDNLANGQNLQEKSKEDIKNNAVIAYYNYLNAVNNALDQINYLIGAEKDGMQLPGVALTLGVKNSQTLTDAKNRYLSIDDIYQQQTQVEINGDNIMAGSASTVKLLSQTKDLIDATIIVLNNTIANSNFIESALVSQKNSFSGLRTTIINTQTAAQATLNSLQNIDLTNKREIDTLQNAVNISQNQLTLAQTGYDTAVGALQSAKEGKDQALVGSKAALDNARGQFNVLQTQAADLAVKAPIAGQITQKSVEIGSEMSIGKKVAQISQTDAVKIVTGISSADIYKIKIGDKANINEKLQGVITNIDPAADSATKKVTVEISYDNKNKDLIPETLVNVKIPVNGELGISGGSFFVPLQAVAITPNEKFVFIIKDGKAIKVAVESGMTEGEKIEIKNGLKNGDQVVVEGNKELENEDLIEITR
ncbi:MAG: efflux RND transporter periplasmic adaptor subunit [Patescibacteria group bacterium]